MLCQLSYTHRPRAPAECRCRSRNRINDRCRRCKSAPGGNRTPDLRLRRPLLYPTELLAHNARISYLVKRISPDRLRQRQQDTGTEIRDTFFRVGVTGFEPAAPCAQGRCATRLRYTPPNSAASYIRNAVLRSPRLVTKATLANQRATFALLWALMKRINRGRRRAQARARWLTWFFTAAVSCANVLPAGG